MTKGKNWADWTPERNLQLLPDSTPPDGRHVSPQGDSAGRPVILNRSSVDVREYRRREGLTTYLPVSLVAKEWSVTPRRVRFLLCSGRLAGRQKENGYWEVAYPYTLTEGRSGPQMRRYAPKKAERRVE